MILHTLEDDYAISGRFNPVVPDLELLPHSKRLNLDFQEPLGRLIEAALCLANTNPQHARIFEAVDNQLLGKEVRFA